MECSPIQAQHPDHSTHPDDTIYVTGIIILLNIQLELKHVPPILLATQTAHCTQAILLLHTCTSYFT